MTKQELDTWGIELGFRIWDEIDKGGVTPETAKELEDFWNVVYANNELNK